MEFESNIGGEIYRVHLNSDNSKALVNDSEFEYKLIEQNNGRILLRSGTKVYKIDNISVNGRQVSFSLNGSFFEATVKDEQDLLLEKLGFEDQAEASIGKLAAPMPGKILEIMAEEGQSVELGDPLIILEAMKMENELKATADGIINSLHVKQGDNVEKNQILLEIKPSG